MPPPPPPPPSGPSSPVPVNDPVGQGEKPKLPNHSQIKVTQNSSNQKRSENTMSNPNIGQADLMQAIIRQVEGIEGGKQRPVTKNNHVQKQNTKDSDTASLQQKLCTIRDGKRGNSSPDDSSDNESDDKEKIIHSREHINGSQGDIILDEMNKLSNGMARSDHPDDITEKLKSLKSDDPLNLIFVGNPGVGKSTLMNSVAGKILFKSGVTSGRGMTYQLDQQLVGNVTYCDTPGLADEELRKQAGIAISKLLKKGGRCKIFFVVTEEGGRIRQEDKTTMRLILDAAPQIGTKFGILINKCSKGMMEKYADKEFFLEATTYLYNAIKQANQTDSILYLEKKEELEDRDNKYVGAEKFDGLIKFLNIMVPEIILTPKRADDIKTDEYEALRMKMEKNQRLLEADRKRLTQHIRQIELQLKREEQKSEEERRKRAQQMKDAASYAKKEKLVEGAGIAIGGLAAGYGGFLWESTWIISEESTRWGGALAGMSLGAPYAILWGLAGLGVAGTVCMLRRWNKKDESFENDENDGQRNEESIELL